MWDFSQNSLEKCVNLKENTPQSITKVSPRGLCGSVCHDINLRDKLYHMAEMCLCGACRGIVERATVNGGHCKRNNYEYYEIKGQRIEFRKI